MQEHSYHDTESEQDPLSSLLAEWSDPEAEEEEFRSDFFQGMGGRRSKAAFALIAIWGITIALHLVPWGTWLVWSAGGALTVYFLRLILAEPLPDPEPLAPERLAEAPFVSLLVAAKNEEVVIGKLVRKLCNLDYPQDKYEVWVIDDRSTDRTPAILDLLAEQYPQLKVLHREPGSGGGKSGALNEVLPLTKGEIIAVFDADASVSPDLLRRVVPMFDPQNIGAVQVRKAIANPGENFWTKGQQAEMALDSYFQQQRTSIGGLGELRGNGQFVRRQALVSCGGWNEETITDDLDLTLRLHLVGANKDHWDIGFCLLPSVQEEGVTTPLALWHQRSRWSEGGYQRYLDYWRFVLRNQMGFVKSLDLLVFLLFQYILPTAAIPDFLMVILRHHFPVLAPLSTASLGLATLGMFIGIRRLEAATGQAPTSWLKTGFQTLRGMTYILHWFVVIPATTGRMSIRPKRLKWVKTIHQGTGEESLEAG